MAWLQDLGGGQNPAKRPQPAFGPAGALAPDRFRERRVHAESARSMSNRL